MLSHFLPVPPPEFPPVTASTDLFSSGLQSGPRCFQTGVLATGSFQTTVPMDARTAPRRHGRIIHQREDAPKRRVWSSKSSSSAARSFGKSYLRSTAARSRPSPVILDLFFFNEVVRKHLATHKLRDPSALCWAGLTLGLCPLLRTTDFFFWKKD